MNEPAYLSYDFAADHITDLDDAREQAQVDMVNTLLADEPIKLNGVKWHLTACTKY
jgi:hypothetical protein